MGEGGVNFSWFWSPRIFFYFFLIVGLHCSETGIRMIVSGGSKEGKEMEMSWYSFFIGGEYYGLVLAWDCQDALARGWNQYGLRCPGCGHAFVRLTNRRVAKIPYLD